MFKFIQVFIVDVIVFFFLCRLWNGIHTKYAHLVLASISQRSIYVDRVWKKNCRWIELNSFGKHFYRCRLFSNTKIGQFCTTKYCMSAMNEKGFFVALDFFYWFPFSSQFRRNLFRSRKKLQIENPFLPRIHTYVVERMHSTVCTCFCSPILLAHWTYDSDNME